MSDAADGNGSPVSGTGDPLAAFLDGLRGWSRLAGADLPAGPASSPPIILSNGLNADAGVAQLVSALASVTEAHSSYFATPFMASPNDASLHGMVAAAAH